MEMEMEYILEGGLSIGHQQIDPLTSDTRVPERFSNTQGTLEKMGPDLFIQFRHTRRMVSGNHQYMAGIDLIDIHECHDLIV